jgi:N-acetylmuramic acid 6-phosphate etherase
VIAGSTRLKAGTATKLVLNMLTTPAPQRIGKIRQRWWTCTPDLKAARSRAASSRWSPVSVRAADKLLKQATGT